MSYFPTTKEARETKRDDNAWTIALLRWLPREVGSKSESPLTDIVPWREKKSV